MKVSGGKNPDAAMGSGLDAFTKSTFAGQRGLDQLSGLCDYSTAVPQDFRGSAKAVPLDKVEFADATMTAHRRDRTPSLVAGEPSDLLQVTFVVRGEVITSQDGRTAVTHAGEFALLQTATEFVYDMPHGVSRTLTVSVPVSELHSDGKKLALLTSTSLQKTATGRLFTRLVTGLSHGTPVRESRASSFVAHAITDMTRATIDESLGISVDAETHESAIRLRMVEYIGANLENPRLNATTVAKAMRMSVRYVHRLFESEDQTMGRYISTLRVEHLAKALTNSQLPVSEIARRNGFTSTDVARRAFRRQMDMTIPDYRARTKKSA